MPVQMRRFKAVADGQTPWDSIGSGSLPSPGLLSWGIGHNVAAREETVTALSPPPPLWLHFPKG